MFKLSDMFFRRFRMTTRIPAVLLTASAFVAITRSQDDAPRLPQTDRLRLAEAFRLADELQDSVWEGWGKSPFSVLLVTSTHEFLLRHPRPDGSFQRFADDSLLKTPVYARRRVFDPSLLATFPAVGGIPTIVIGQREGTSVGSSTAWVLTLLHEHFHQYQQTLPHYFADAESLHLSDGDASGMWMLTYPFPYASEELDRAFRPLSLLLYDALPAQQEPNMLQVKSGKFRNAVRAFTRMLSPRDRSYMSFQLWQEGVARYIELRTARIAAARYIPSAQFTSLPDYVTFQQASDSLQRNVSESLRTLSLRHQQRIVFYSFGAAEAELLDSVNPEWHKLYPVEKFQLHSFFTR